MDRSGLDIADAPVGFAESSLEVGAAHMAALVSALVAGGRVVLIGADDAVADEVERGAEHVRRVDALEAVAYLGDAGEELVVVNDVEAGGNAVVVLERLRAQARAGRRVVVVARNPLLRAPRRGQVDAALGLERITGELPAAEGWTILFHHLAQGSLLVDGDERAERAELVRPLQAEPDYASAFIGLANIDPGELAAVRAHAALVLEPRFDRYLQAMQRSREQLGRLNVELGRQHLGVADAAAASILDKLRMRTSLAEQELEAARHAIGELEVECLRRHDLMLAEAARADRLEAEVAGAARYRIADAAHRRVTSFPGVGRAVRAAGRRLRRG